MPLSQMISIMDQEVTAQTRPARRAAKRVPISTPATRLPPEKAAITRRRRVEAKEVAPHLARTLVLVSRTPM